MNSKPFPASEGMTSKTSREYSSKPPMRIAPSFRWVENTPQFISRSALQRAFNPTEEQKDAKATSKKIMIHPAPPQTSLPE